MPTQVMLDIETLGKKPGAALVAIGAVKFAHGYILDEFYARIDVKSCLEAGLEMEASTVFWWLKQSDAARLEITQPGRNLNEVLQDFSGWLADPEVLIWGNGAAFDNVLLSYAYEAAHEKTPWKYSNDRCYRTVKNLHSDIPMERTGLHHHALEDARDQANHLMKILNF